MSENCFHNFCLYVNKPPISILRTFGFTSVTDFFQIKLQSRLGKNKAEEEQYVQQE